MSRFVLTAGGRIVTRQDYEREQRFVRDWERYERMERVNREWQEANREV